MKQCVRLIHLHIWLYIGSEEFAVVCGSPELLVKKKGKELSTRPIAGTRPRGKCDEEDIALSK